MRITLFYGALLGLLFVFLSVRVLMMRRTLRIAVGDGASETMLRVARVHANFAEYVPFALLLMFFVESRGVYPAFVHLLGVALSIGRVAHAYGVSRVDEDFRYRVLGVGMTLTTISVSCLYLLFAVVAQAVG